MQSGHFFSPFTAIRHDMGKEITKLRVHPAAWDGKSPRSEVLSAFPQNHSISISALIFLLHSHNNIFILWELFLKIK